MQDENNKTRIRVYLMVMLAIIATDDDDADNDKEQNEHKRCEGEPHNGCKGIHCNPPPNSHPLGLMVILCFDEV